MDGLGGFFSGFDGSNDPEVNELLEPVFLDHFTEKHNQIQRNVPDSDNSGQKSLFGSASHQNGSSRLGSPSGFMFPQVGGGIGGGNSVPHSAGGLFSAYNVNTENGFGASPFSLQFGSPNGTSSRGNVFAAAAVAEEYGQNQYQNTMAILSQQQSAIPVTEFPDLNDDHEDEEDEELDEDDAGNSDSVSNNQGSSRVMSNEEKRLKRLERNRESARQSRKRKKQYLELLEVRVAALQQQIYEFRTSHVASANQVLDEQRRLLLLNLEPIAQKENLTPEEEAALEDGVQQLIDRFGPFCPERQMVREFHFEQLQQLLLPPHAKFLLWLVHQPNNFFSVAAPSSAVKAPVPEGVNRKDKDAQKAENVAKNAITMWSLICSEIGLSVDQAERLRSQLRKVLGGPDVPRESWRLGIASGYIQRLRASLSVAAARAQTNLASVSHILRPAQMIRYLAYVERNSAVISNAIQQTLQPQQQQQQQEQQQQS